jgi:hypothetical protein
LKSKKKRQDEFQFQIDRTRERFFNNDQKRKTLEREFYLSKQKLEKELNRKIETAQVNKRNKI